MSQLTDRKALLDAQRKDLAVKIKLDIARALRHQPLLDNTDEQRAFAELASDENIDHLIRELAREECEAAIERGELPPAAIIHLAGYRQNPIAEG